MKIIKILAILMFVEVLMGIASVETPKEAFSPQKVSFPEKASFPPKTSFYGKRLLAQDPKISGVPENSGSADGVTLSTQIPINPQEVRLGATFSISLILNSPQEIIVLSYLDKRYLENLDLLRQEEEIFFTFRAKKVGQTEIIFDRLTTSLKTEYFAHRIMIVPGTAPRENTPRASAPEEDNEDEEQQALFRLVQGWIDGKDVLAAERAFLRYVVDFSLDFGYRMDIILNLANLYLEKDLPEKALTLVREELKQNTSAMSEQDIRRLKMSRGYLERITMNYDEALGIWLDLKRELTPKHQEYPRILFELGETLFAADQYGSAHNEYKAFLRYYKNQKTEPPAQHHFLTLYRLARIYEKDPVIRDYQQAYDYYLQAHDFHKATFETDDSYSQDYEDEKQQTRERIQFIEDHFIRIR